MKLGGARRVLLALLLGACAFGCNTAGSVLAPDVTPGDGNWLVRQTEHLLIKYRPDSAAARDIDSLAATLEGDVQKVTSYLGVEYHSRITFVVYASLADKEEHGLVKGTTCYSMPSAELAVGVYDPPRDVYAITPHEITHVIAYWTVGVGTQDMLIEGLAVATTGSYWADTPVHAGAAGLLRQRKLRPLALMFDNEAWLKLSDEDEGVYYNQAGSFVQYLIDTRGNQRFRQFYNRASEAEYEAAFQEIYAIPIDAFYSEWLDFLNRGA